MKSIPLAASISAALLLTSCGGYNTDYPPPTGKEKLRELVPEEIGGAPLRAEKLDLDPDRYFATRSNYGTDTSITIVQCDDQEAIDTYVKETVVPSLEEGYSSRASGKINGAWRLKGSGSRGRIRGWQNRNWIFLIKAANDELFDEAVENFPYISRK